MIKNVNQKGLNPLLIIILAVALVGGYFVYSDKIGVYQQISQPSPTPDVNRSCRPTGCSGQICSDEDVITTCEYSAEYACYENAKCERQKDGKCDWTNTPELQACLKNPPPL